MPNFRKDLEGLGQTQGPLGRDVIFLYNYRMLRWDRHKPTVALKRTQLR